MAKTQTRYYVVTEQLVSDGALSGKTTEYLVEANSQAHAIRHIVKPRFTAEPADAKEVFRLMNAGVKLQTATVEPEASE